MTRKPDNNKINKKRSKGKIILLSVLLAFVSIILIIAIVFLSLFFCGKSSLFSSNVVITPTDNIDTEVYDDETVSYNGKRYKYNENITTVLFIGVDYNKNDIALSHDVGNNGQADALYLIAADISTGKCTVLGIPRDAMTDIDLYSSSGSYIGVKKAQICLSYAYGDGKEESCKNTAIAISRFLYGMPVNSYFAIDYRSVAAINDAVGPITVVPNEDLVYQVEGKSTKYYFNKGKAVSLKGDNVYPYLRARNSETADSSYLRMERQLDYIKKYSSLAISKTKANITFPVSLYNKISKNSITDITVSKIAYASTNLITSDKLSLEFKSIEGEQKIGEKGFVEFYPDENKLFGTIIETFYKEI